jgi:hypothetical protein
VRMLRIVKGNEDGFLLSLSEVDKRKNTACRFF